VRNYVSAILSNLGVTDRTQAAVLAIRAGLREATDGDRRSCDSQNEKLNPRQTSEKINAQDAN
jgi:hypothetical protein